MDIDKNKQLNNVIIAKINIEEKNKKVRIINSGESVLKNRYDIIQHYEEINETTFNESQIKESEIYINNEKISFNYYYKFPESGQYIIKYKFNKLLNSTFCLFYDCSSFESLDLSNFNTNNIKNMAYMFGRCINLKLLDLTNFNTENTTTMQGLFYYCNSLALLDLSSFNTQSVINMEEMSEGCTSIISLDFQILKQEM